jgi:hypothetical protein
MFGLVAILSAYKNAAIGLFVAALLTAIGVQTVRLNYAELKAAVLVARAEELTVQIVAQNAGIAAMQAVGDAQKVAAAKAAGAAQKALARASARATRIETAPVPQTCPDAIQFLVNDAAEAP